MLTTVRPATSRANVASARRRTSSTARSSESMTMTTSQISTRDSAESATGRAQAGEGLRLVRGPVPDDEFVARSEQVAGHRLAHDAQADEAERHEAAPPALAVSRTSRLSNR